MSRDRSASAFVLALLIALVIASLSLNSCALTPSRPIVQQQTESGQAQSGQNDIRIYGTLSTSITHATR